ncbi:hypothetical protein ACFY1P_19215 [Streptomyces sp. NPDC001407]|uniref:hypothetical protein n=1 Tax=Streptomyces sp. NPDC001407 TaxID=3364573 RepID=UPI0036784452
MTTSRCDHCDLIIGAGCACSPQPPQRKIAAHPDWGNWDPNTILISPTQYAHIPGCTHLSESEIKAPRWGWTTVATGTWSRISSSQPVRATAGNTDRVATRRCQTCNESA